MMILMMIIMMIIMMIKKYNNVSPGSVFLNNSNNLKNEISNVKSDGEYYVRLIAHQNATIEKLKKRAYR